MVFLQLLLLFFYFPSTGRASVSIDKNMEKAIVAVQNDYTSCPLKSTVHIFVAASATVNLKKKQKKVIFISAICFACCWDAVTP